MRMLHCTVIWISSFVHFDNRHGGVLHANALFASEFCNCVRSKKKNRPTQLFIFTYGNGLTMMNATASSRPRKRGIEKKASAHHTMRNIKDISSFFNCVRVCVPLPAHGFFCVGIPHEANEKFSPLLLNDDIFLLLFFCYGWCWCCCCS